MGKRNRLISKGRELSLNSNLPSSDISTNGELKVEAPNMSKFPVTKVNKTDISLERIEDIPDVMHTLDETHTADDEKLLADLLDLGPESVDGEVSVRSEKLNSELSCKLIHFLTNSNKHDLFNAKIVSGEISHSAGIDSEAFFSFMSYDVVLKFGLDIYPDDRKATVLGGVQIASVGCCSISFSIGNASF